MRSIATALSARRPRVLWDKSGAAASSASDLPAGSVEINRDLACRTEGDQVIYYNGHLPVFTHTKRDLASFRLFTSQLIVQGSATQGAHRQSFWGAACGGVGEGARSLHKEG